MSDAMVTARMSQEKKEAGGSVLEELGVTASQAINGLYDHLIAHGELPFAPKRRRYSSAEWEAAVAWVDALPILVPESPLASMADREIKEERLRVRGLFEGIESGRAGVQPAQTSDELFFADSSGAVARAEGEAAV